jgi:hypothetical protein
MKGFLKYNHQQLTLQNLMASKGSSGSAKHETAYLIAESVNNYTAGAFYLLLWHIMYIT